jgi:hypothetical protein
VIGTVALDAPVAAVADHRRHQRRREPVVAVEQHAAFVVVAVAAEHQIHAGRFQHRQDVLPHLRQLDVDVGIVRALAIRRVVPESDNPVGVRRVQIAGQPLQHGPAQRPAGLVGIEADEVDAAVVERVVGLGARGDAAGLAGRREREDVVVGSALRCRIGADAVVVAERRPQHARAQQCVIDVEDADLVLGVGAAGVGVVAEHQP